MISLLSALPALHEPLIGCTIETLNACYAAIFPAVDLYRSDAGGILCRFGGRLLVSGKVAPDELRSFASMMGVMRIEGLSRDVPALPGWRENFHTLLVFSGTGAPLPGEVNVDPDMKWVYELLCRVDGQFSRRAQYLPWLSDLALRRRRARAWVFTLDNAATACVSAIGCGAGLISSVAVDPARRGEGLGGALVQSVAKSLCAEGIQPVVAAQDNSLDLFYKRLGFSAVGRLTVLTVHSEEYQ